MPGEHVCYSIMRIRRREPILYLSLYSFFQWQIRVKGRCKHSAQTSTSLVHSDTVNLRVTLGFHSTPKGQAVVSRSHILSLSSFTHTAQLEDPVLCLVHLQAPRRRVKETTRTARPTLPLCLIPARNAHSLSAVIVIRMATDQMGTSPMVRGVLGKGGSRSSCPPSADQRRRAARPLLLLQRGQCRRQLA
jgi:hypothetical protein